MSYNIKDVILLHLKNDISFFEENKYDKLGKNFDECHNNVYKKNMSENLNIAINFWDCLIDAANHNLDVYDFTKEEWLSMGKTIIIHLEEDKEIQDK